MLTALYSFGPGLCLKTLCPRGAFSLTGDLSGLKQSALIGGALAGALVSLSFATLSGAAATPLWPLYDGVLLSDPFSSWRLQRLSARFLPLALLIWGFKSMGGRQ